MKENKISRMHDVDMAKGVAIILVVVGHCYSKTNLLLQWINAFHLPLFFILSGLIYGNRKEKKTAQSFSRIVLKKARSNLIPYYIFCGLQQLLVVVLRAISNPAVFFPELMMRGKLLLQWNAGSQWFLPAMFIASCLFLLLKQYRYGWVPMLILSIVGILPPSDETRYIVFLRGCTGLSFIAIGFYSTKLWERTLHPVQVSMLLGVQIILAFMNPTVSLVSRRFGHILLYYVNGILGTYVILQLCRLGSRYLRKVAEVCRYFGENSLIILCIHGIFIECIRLAEHFLVKGGLSSLGIEEGLLIGMLVCTLSIPAIKFCRKYMYAVFYV